MKRAHGFMPTYSRFEILCASSAKPTPQKDRNSQMSAIRYGMTEMETALHPTRDDWRVVSDVVNLMETIVTEGWATDVDGLLDDAIGAMAEAGTRHLAGASIRLDGPGLRAVRAVLADYETCLDNLSERNMKYAHVATERRVWEITHGRPQAHDITVVRV